MRKKFGIDIDGTVTSPNTIVPYMNQDFGLSLSYSDIKEYDLSVHVDISKSDFAKWWLDNEARIYEASPLTKEVRAVLREWESAHDLFFISARSKHLLELTKEWFVKQDLPFHHIELIGSHDKINAAKQYEVDIFFEDKHDNAVAICEQCKIPVILFNTPYNQEPVPEGVIRVNNWSEAKAWVDTWLKENA
ncbi:hypothetical protein WMO40_05780 [Bacillaceae bacterium CLA-AA-H227]|uniref:Uncharacterized protein n=1 Tax=Robertmurraya yapensis (ex Hitch et al 2024) TaxID=3133160 RepID=A0ACC6S879_9BACI